MVESILSRTDTTDEEWKIFFDLVFLAFPENREKRRKSSVMSHGRRREIIPSLHKCMGHAGRQWDVGREHFVVSP